MQRVLLCAGLVGTAIALLESAQAQVVPDGTLNTTVTSSGNVFTITNGTVRGSNLFHSFGQFSVPTNGAANFELGNTPGISTVFGRVTGGSPSSIDGTIRTLLNNSPTPTPVDLFLLNPSGILFGANARLAISGSFVGTTADRIRFENGVEFPATAIEPPLLVQTAPIGLQFGTNPGAIVNRSPNLAVRPQQTFALIGGEVAFEGGRIAAPNGRVELGSVSPTATPETVRLDRSDGTVRFDFSTAPSQGGVSLTNGRVDVSAARTGDIAVHGRTVTLSAGSRLTANVNATGSTSVRSGDIMINALDAVRVDDSLISGEVTQNSVGNLGNITINTGTFSAIRGGQISSQTRSQGNAGNITISARETVTFAGQNNTPTFSGIQNRVRSTGIGNAGDITINAKVLEMLDGAYIATNTGGRGNAGNITFNVRDTITLRGVDREGDGNLLEAAVSQGGVGNGGSINITARSMNHQDGAQIFTGINAGGRGNGANLTITLQDSLRLSGQDRSEGSSFVGVVASGATGNAGSIQVSANTIEATDGGYISASTQGNGNGGNITLNAVDRITFSGFDQGGRSSRISSNAGSLTNPGRTANTSGSGGKITLTTNAFSLSNGALIRSGVSNQGNGGTITVNANTVDLSSGGQLYSSTLSASKAGDINLNVRDRVTLSGSRSSTEGSITVADPLATGTEILSGIYANATRRSNQPADQQITGQGGSVQITANRLDVFDRAQINVSNPESGNAGNLTIHSNSLLLDSGASLTANVVSGEQGNIAIATQDLLMQNSSITTNTAGSGNAGQINLTASRATLANSQISSQSTGSGNAGTLSIAAQAVTLDRASKLTTESTNAGQAGNVLVQADQVSLQNNSEITSRSRGTGNGGTIEIRANRLSLSQGSVLNAQTASGDGGNILLTLTTLLTLNNQSLLSAEAGGSGNGGNIGIQADYILGSGNSDMIANAERGRGGNIQITTQGMFGLAFRDLQNPQTVPTNDITASSEFSVNGTVQIDVLSIDPNSGLVELPNVLVDPSQQIAQGCQANPGSRFVITGRGGVPTNPMETVSYTPSLWSDLRAHSSSQTAAVQAPERLALFVEASSWQRNSTTGNVELVAGHSLASHSATCAL